MTKNKNDKKDLKQFGITLGLILALLGTIQYFKHHISIYPWFFLFSVLSILLGIIAPALLRPIYKLFIKLTHAIGWFNTRVILIICYYIILTPTGLVMRLLGKDFLDKKIEKSVDSYWIKKDRFAPNKETLEKQF
jgi:hypothetical protein